MKAHAPKQPQPQQQVSSKIRRLSVEPLAASQTDHPILHLQRTIGNQAVQRLLHANAEGLEANSDTLVPTSFTHHSSRIPVRSSVHAVIQPKLTANTPGDMSGQEADNVAEPEDEGQEQLLEVQKKSLAISDPNDPDEQEADEVARKVIAGQPAEIHGTDGAVKRSGEGSAETTPAFQSEVESSKGGGHSLDASTKSEMESRMGADFSGVKVHTGREAHHLSESINAKAFTHGQDIYFNSDQSPHDQELMAHELAHTVQQKGHVQRKIQRAMKFEFQTSNLVWAVKETGAPDPLLLPRKFAPSSDSYEERGGSEESGKKPAYLSVGKHGKAARDAGYGYVEVEGPLVMKKAKDADASKYAQFEKVYVYLNPVEIGKPVAAGRLRLIRDTNNAMNPSMEDKYNPNTFEFKYLDGKGKQLMVHLDEDGLFQKGHVKHMKVGKGERKDIDYDKEAQKIEIWKVTIDAAGKVDYKGKKAKVEQVGKTVDYANHKKYPEMKGKYNPGTYEKNYYLSTDFDGDKPKPTAKRLKVHLSKDGSSLKEGHAKFMEYKKLPEAEQTAIELQSEHEGYLEFETPKWFDDWSELKLRIQDAVDMTEAITDSPEEENEAILDAIDKKKTGSELGRVVKWPKAYSTSHLTKLAKDKRKLLVQIVDENWWARIQSSFEASLSQYADLLEAGSYGSVDYVPATINSAELIFNAGFDEVKGIAAKKPAFKDKGKEKVLDLTKVNKSDLANLKGFLQIITNYLIRGQHMNFSENPAKDLARVMSRTSFYSMYHSILSEKERLLFQYLVKHNTITKTLEAPINQFLKANQITYPLPKSKKEYKTPDTTMSGFAAGDTLIYRKGHKGGSGPKINEWLNSIIHGYKVGDTTMKTDKLSPPERGSGAMGAHKAGAEPGEENVVRFEVRYSKKLFGGQDKPADEWVSYAKQLFEWAAKRGDTPDNPATPDINEAAKTGLTD